MKLIQAPESPCPLHLEMERWLKQSLNQEFRWERDKKSAAERKGEEKAREGKAEQQEG